MKKMVMLIVLLLAVPGLAFAYDLDLRLKGGAAAGLDGMNMVLIHATGSGDSSRNLQVELAIIPSSERRVSPVFTIGCFDREHAGTVSDPILKLPPTGVEYNVQGITVGAGARVNAWDNLHFEVRFEGGAGKGKPDLPKISSAWTAVKKRSYESFSFIIGSYYTFSRPQLQLGVEVGGQEFWGDFEIWNSGGYWKAADVTGSGGIVNLVAGYRF